MSAFVKTLVVMAVVWSILWTCGGGPGPNENTPDCYAEINTAVLDDWANLSQAQRGIIGFKSIQICEGVQP